jgi:hypothetical protein
LSGEEASGRKRPREVRKRTQSREAEFVVAQKRAEAAAKSFGRHGSEKSARVTSRTLQKQVKTETTTGAIKKQEKKKKNKMKTSKLVTWSRIILPRNVRNGRSDISRKMLIDHKKNLSTLSFHTFPHSSFLHKIHFNRLALFPSSSHRQNVWRSRRVPSDERAESRSL